MVTGHQCLTVGDDHPSRTGDGVPVGVEQFESITKAGQNELLHGENGAFIRLQDDLGGGVLFHPQAVHSHESSVAISGEHGPAADVQRRCALVVNLHPVLGRLDGIVVAVRQYFGNGEVR